MEFNEWVLKTAPNRLILRLNVQKRIWARRTDEFTALLLGCAKDVDGSRLLGELWIQVSGASIVDKKIWTSDEESEWHRELNRKHAILMPVREGWKVQKEHVFTVTEELQVGSQTTFRLPLSNLLVIEYLALLQGLLMNMFLSRQSKENRLLRNMAHQLEGVRRESYGSVFAGIA